MIKSFFYCLLVFVICAIPVGFFTRSTWEAYLDKEGPSLKIMGEVGKVGIGSSGGRFEVAVSDGSPGIDEVIVRLRQLRSDYELFRKKLGGVHQATIKVELSGQNQGFAEGEGQLEIVAFDRSFYNNRGSIITKAFVDTKTPTVEVISTQHNLRQGGTQLVIYSAYDDNLAYSGVAVGETIFKGYPISQIDSSITKKGVYAAFYTVPIANQPGQKNISPNDISVIAVDIGGNKVEKTFYNKIAKRNYRYISNNNSRLSTWLAANTLKQNGAETEAANEGSESTSNTQLKQQGAIDASSLIRGLDKVGGTSLLVYSDKIRSESNLEDGDSYVFTGVSSARALSAGEVKKISDLKNSAFIVEVNHGLGLSTFYKGLKNVIVREGQQVKAGDTLGAVDSYVAIGAKISDVAVDLTELWSEDWVYAHINEKLQEAKRSLGIETE